MRDLDARIVHRVKGRPALTKSLGGLLVRAHRFSRCRAATPSDRWWAAKVIDALQTAYDVARSHVDAGPGGPA